MSNERERLAREWAEQVKSVPEVNYGPGANAAADHILATTKEPTMADVEWDAEKHVLAGATLLTDNDEQVDVVMLAKDVSLIEYATMGGEYGYEHCSYFTPNGKMYELVEVTGGEHPETLRTVEDYENAPGGTIVAQDGCDSWVKTNTNIWACGVVTYVNRDMSATGPYRVLRWGWGE